jgi:hypothetical protein
MATLPNSPGLPAANKPRPSMRRSSSTRARRGWSCRSYPATHGLSFLRSADLAGRTVHISPDIPVMFDRPLAAHHKLVGSWVASKSRRQCTARALRRADISNGSSRPRSSKACGAARSRTCASSCSTAILRGAGGRDRLRQCRAARSRMDRGQQAADPVARGCVSGARAHARKCSPDLLLR